MITGAFGFTVDLRTGQLRKWYARGDGARKWADTDEPVDVGPPHQAARGSKDAILARAVQIRASIQQIFDDAAHWNSRHVPWKGAPIEPDPDGELRRIAEGIDRMLEAEAPDTQPATKAALEDGAP